MAAFGPGSQGESLWTELTQAVTSQAQEEVRFTLRIIEKGLKSFEKEGDMIKL